MAVNVKDIMTPHVICVSTEDIVTKVDEIFNSHSIHHIPVLSTDGKIAGIISKSDFERISSGKSMFKLANRKEYNKTLYRTLRAVEIMTKNVQCIDSEVNLKEAIHIFRQNRVRALPVIHDDEIVGIITPYDIMIYYADHCKCS
jgi:CBS domain-containing protein